ncbi:unnamed protein product [Didymodactylos carnosus]|uniref:Uncharacterized protein n=1 Tax=Didymodactylos carnosus TaxID=1234261 RepID=A0A8S2E9S2_9BILA|nr:unnamed protein product [Didymodactylos carnosus]CAF3850017.1 unnamed protein product [Didymodactylos carnosus]
MSSAEKLFHVKNFRNDRYLYIGEWFNTVYKLSLDNIDEDREVVASLNTAEVSHVDKQSKYSVNTRSKQAKKLKLNRDSSITPSSNYRTTVTSKTNESHNSPARKAFKPSFTIVNNTKTGLTKDEMIANLKDIHIDVSHDLPVDDLHGLYEVNKSHQHRGVTVTHSDPLETDDTNFLCQMTTGSSTY